jgi:Ca2+-binding EF-hand superfamily protein
MLRKEPTMKVLRLPATVTLVLVVSLWPGSGAPLYAQGTPGRDCEAVFRSLDGNHDEQVSLEELLRGSAAQTYAHRKVIKEALVSQDKNGDGALDREEFCAATPAEASDPGEACRAEFAAMDTSHDGRLDVAEFLVGNQARTYASRKMSRQTFVMIDSNRDGVLTEEEFCQPETPQE